MGAMKRFKSPDGSAEVVAKVVAEGGSLKREATLFVNGEFMSIRVGYEASKMDISHGEYEATADFTKEEPRCRWKKWPSKQ